MHTGRAGLYVDMLRNIIELELYQGMQVYQGMEVYQCTDWGNIQNIIVDWKS
jgi:hypothetical protein